MILDMPPLRPFTPESNCAKCNAEDIVVIWHPGGVAGAPCWPADARDRVFTEHVCKRCTRCGYGWCEQPADAGAYANTQESWEDPLSIQKTAASGQVLGTEGTAGVIKTAQQDLAVDPAWKADDEAALEQENTAADQG
jgi:hypothetical protein